MTMMILGCNAALAALAALGGVLASPAAAEDVPLHLTRTIPLPGVLGRIDHLAADVAGRRVFVAALGNGTLEVVDLAKGARVQSVPGLEEPQGVVFLPDLARVVVATGGGAVIAYDAASLKPVARLDKLDDADNVRYDPAARLLYVGYGDGALAAIEPGTLRKVANLGLTGHPESFQLEKGGPLVYVNVPHSRHLVVLDRKRQAVQATIPLPGHAANFPMALDERHHRLFVGTRSPAKLVVVDTASHALTDIDCVGDTDDVFYDGDRERVYVTGGDGSLDVFDAREGARLTRLARLPTGTGARTSLWIPEWRRLLVAAPAGFLGSRPAALLVFEAP
jgi:DNA-binding beta-propeller fold protein YncE